MWYKKYTFLLCIGLSACSWLETSSLRPSLEPRHDQAKKVYRLHHIQRVHLQGGLDVSLSTSARQGRLTVLGSTDALDNIEVRYKHQALYVRCIEACEDDGQVKLVLQTPSLRSLVYDGHGSIEGKHLRTHRLNLGIRNSQGTYLSGRLGLNKVVMSGGGVSILDGVHSRALDLQVKNNTKLKVKGEIYLAHLHMNDGAWLSLYWLKGHRVELRGRGKTFIQLAGRVKVLDVELFNQARFNGRYLTADDTFIKTHDRSIAEITSWGHQHALALGASDIDYFQNSKTQTNLMGDDGSILDFYDWKPAEKGNLFYPVKH